MPTIRQSFEFLTKKWTKEKWKRFAFYIAKKKKIKRNKDIYLTMYILALEFLERDK